MAEEAQLRALSSELRAASARLDARGAALGRYALVWWEGGAAEVYQQRVAQRVSCLRALAHAMDEAAELLDTVAAVAGDTLGFDP